MRIQGTLTATGLNFGEHNMKKLRQYSKDNPGTRVVLETINTESRKMRGFFEGGVVPLVTFYQEGMSHTDSEDCRRVREWLKLEFNGDFLVINGKANKVAKSTKGELGNGFLERVIEWLEENYAPPREALDTEKYRIWKDTIWPYGGAPNWIDYLVDIGLIK